MRKAVKAALILSVFTFIERTLGFLFKIFLSRELGAAAIGIYQVSLSFFIVLLTLITSGIPLTVSKMTAKCRAEGSSCREGSITVSALITGLSVATICALVVFVFNKPISEMFASQKSMMLVILMLPSLFFSAIYAAFRGNLWGRQKYALVSALELIEQICRIICFVILLLTGFDKLNATAVSMSVSCFLSATSCVISYLLLGGKISKPNALKPLIKSAFPVTMARVSTGLVTSLTGIVIPMFFMLSGLSSQDAMYIYGYSVGMAMPLIFMPLTFVGSISFVLIPSLSTATAEHNDKSVVRQIEKALEVSIALGVMFFPMFYVIGKPIGVFLYGNADAGRYLSSAAWLILPVALENITSSMMNSLDLEYKGLLNYFIGSAVMFAIMAVCCKRFDIKYYTLGMGISLTLSSCLDIICMRKKIKFGKGILPALIKNCLLLYPACCITKWTYNLTSSLPPFFRIAIGGGTGVVFLTVLFFLFGSLKFEYFFGTKRAKKRKKKVANTASL